MQEIVSAVDIGTTKICALMAAVGHDSLGNLSLNLLGVGEAASRGIRRGVVVNVTEVIAAVAEAVEKCEHETRRSMLSCYVGIAGSHIKTMSSRGVSPVDSHQGVTGMDMQRALEAARAVALPENHQVIHTIARTWTVDEQSQVQQPLGLSAYRLEVDAHIVTGSRTAVNNVVQAIREHGIEVDGLVLEPLASNEAVLKPEERRMGVAVVDMGGGTTDIAVFMNDHLANTAILDVGGHHLTNDIAVGLHAPFETAEELKQRYGHAQPDRIAEDEKVWATVFGERGERSFSRRFISQILEARAEELFELVAAKVQELGYQNRLPAGVVLTGGASQLPGLSELGRQVFNMPVRVGSPSPLLPIANLNRSLLTPAYATSVGLLLWGLYEDARSEYLHRDDKRPSLRESPWMDQAGRLIRSLLPG